MEKRPYLALGPLLTENLRPEKLISGERQDDGVFVIGTKTVWRCEVTMFMGSGMQCF